MSVYSTSVASDIIDPTFMSQSRCEFRLQNRGQSYMTNMKLGGLGLVVGAAAGSVPYARGVGVAGIISRIRLMDSEQLLDELRDVNSWMCFKSFLRSNAHAADIDLPKAAGGGGRGFTSSTSQIIESTPAMEPLAYTDIDTSYGTLDLREVFPFLSTVKHLNTKVYKNLRVIIEWETNLSKSLQDTAAAATKGTPFLMVDEIMDAALVSALDKDMLSGPVEFDAVEVDKMALPEIPGIAAKTGAALNDELQQDVTLRANGFNGKFCKRMMLQKMYSDAGLLKNGTAVRGLGLNGSVAMHKEAINLRLNGRNVLAGAGINSPARLAMSIADAYGDLNCVPYGHIESVGLDGGIAATAAVNCPAGVPITSPNVAVADVGAAVLAQQNALVGQYAYAGFVVHERAANLALRYVRSGHPQSTAAFPTGTTSARGGDSEGLTLSLWGEVVKTLTVNPDMSYRIDYM